MYSKLRYQKTYLAVSVRQLIGDSFMIQITGTPLTAQVSQSAQWAVSKSASAHDALGLMLVKQ
jgi:hypothetical protein